MDGGGLAPILGIWAISGGARFPSSSMIWGFPKSGVPFWGVPRIRGYIEVPLSFVGGSHIITIRF